MKTLPLRRRLLNALIFLLLIPILAIIEDSQICSVRTLSTEVDTPMHGVDVQVVSAEIQNESAFWAHELDGELQKRLGSVSGGTSNEKVVLSINRIEEERNPFGEKRYFVYLGLWTPDGKRLWLGRASYGDGIFTGGVQLTRFLLNGHADSPQARMADAIVEKLPIAPLKSGRGASE